MTGPSTVATLADRPVRRPARVSVTPWGVEQVTAWTVTKVRRAIDAHERGDFSMSAQLVDAMGRDDRIAACLGTRLRALTSKSGAAFSVEPAEGVPESIARPLADDVSAWWLSQVPEATTARILRDGIMLGVSISRVEWETGDQWLPRLTPWPMQHVSWDDTEGGYAVQAKEGRFIVRSDDPAWLIYTPSGLDRAWMSGLVRSLGLPFMYRTLSYRDWGRFSERHGLPIIKIKEPPTWAADDRDAFASSLSRMGSEGVVQLPQSGDGAAFDVELLEARSTSWQSFEAWRSDLATSIAIMLLGQNLSTEVKGGSMAAARVQDRVRTDYLASDAETLSTCYRAGLLIPWLSFNRAGVAHDAAPWLTWDTTTPTDAKDEAAAMLGSAQAMQAFRKLGLRVDYAALAERMGIPMLPGDAMDDDEPDETEPPAAVRPPEDDADETEPDDDAGEEAMRLASGDSAPGFTNGQRYIDRLTDATAAQAMRALRPTVSELLTALGEARTFDEARSAIAAVYAAADTREIEVLAERAMIIAQLSGRAAVVEDL